MPRKRKGGSVGHKLIVLGALDFCLTLLMFWPRKARPRRAPRPGPDLRGIPTALGERAIRPYLAQAQELAAMPGLATLGKALALSRSRYDNKSVDTTLASKACGLYLRLRETVLAGSPYAERDWCFGGGGWYRFIPAEVMVLEPFPHRDPKLVFDPAASTAMLAGVIHRIAEQDLPQLPPSERTWLAVRRALENLDALYDYTEEAADQTGSRRIREDFTAELRAIGADPAFAATAVSAGPYPGTEAVWAGLRPLSTT